MIDVMLVRSSACLLEKGKGGGMVEKRELGREGGERKAVEGE